MNVAGAYALGSLASCGVTVALTPLVGRLARVWGIVDRPNSRKIHDLPTPRIGGIAIALATFIIFIPILLAIDRGYLPAVHDRSRLTTLLGSMLFVALVGLADDVFELPASSKLLSLFAAALALCVAGIRIDGIQLSHNFAVPLGNASWPLTMLWVVGVAVSINFIDGLDGLAAGIVTIAAVVLAISASRFGSDPVVALLAVCLAGSLCGFLIFNFNPARIFMGDSGSMFIGFTFGAATVMCSAHAGTTLGLVVPGLALTIPLTDVLLTFVRRGVLQRRSLFSAERGHIHHNLLDQGLTQRQAVLVLYALSLIAAGVGMAVLFWGGWAMAGALALLIVSVGFVFRTSGSTRLRETIVAIRRNRALGRESRRYRIVFEEMQTRFRNIRSFDSWWEHLCTAAEMLDFVALTLPLVNRDGTPRILHWRRAVGELDGCEIAKATLPIDQRRAGGPLRAEIEVAAATFLESAGQRIALFSRLVTDHSLARVQNAPAGQHALLAEIGDVALGDAALLGGPRRARSRRPATRFALPGLRGMPPGTMGAKPPAAAPARSLPLSPIPISPSAQPTGPRVAIVHDFLYVYAGAERVLEQIVSLYPDADLFALFDFLPKGERDFIRNKPVHTSFIQHMPFARNLHRSYLPLMPLAIEQLDLGAYDIVISSSYVAAKGIITRPNQLHICYCHTPARFAWDLQSQYVGRASLLRGVRSILARVLLHYIRQWDAHSANRVDVFISNSDFVGGRIRKIYRRDSTTIYPPVDIHKFTLHADKADYYLTASRLVPYKRIELIIDAFSQMPDKKLIVIGDGPEFARLQALAGANVRMVGHQPLDRLCHFMQHARAFIFAAEEDFGIAPVEAQACGTPVIAFAEGGVTESILPGRTGVFFPKQTAESIIGAVQAFEAAGPWDAADIRRNAERFAPERFRAQLRSAVEIAWHACQASSRRSNVAAPLPSDISAPARPESIAATDLPDLKDTVDVTEE
jgi:UDP-N-acetylmuramyl pentapeptide phosphotransferase/UDP-N-acetylglucosamine-1-phosphate transferase/glycosyltransferase involved in cell wall biosynthesis